MNENNFSNHNYVMSIESSLERKYIKYSIWIICLSVFLIFIWSTLAVLDEVSKSRGQVIPLGHKQIIQSKSGGMVQSVDVTEGDFVKKGQPLVHFVSIDSQSLFDELQAKEANLQMKLLRYESIINDTPLKLEQFSNKYPDLTNSHLIAYEKIKNQQNVIVEVSKSEISKINAEIDSLQNELPVIKKQLSSSKKILSMMNSVNNNAISKVKIYEEEEKIASYLREFKAINGKLIVLEKTLDNLNRQLEKKEIDMLLEFSEKRTDVQTELISIKAKLRSSSSDVNNNVIKAPIDGVIQSIPTTSSGGVISPGGMVAIIVPTTKEGLIETRLSPKDIGFVNVGDKARIKVDAFDYSRYGVLDGIVTNISPTTDTDEKNGVYYKVKISIKKPYFMDESFGFRLIPGMTVEADIVTGEKTIFEYIWKPVFVNISSAFNER